MYKKIIHKKLNIYVQIFLTTINIQQFSNKDDFFLSKNVHFKDFQIYV